MLPTNIDPHFLTYTCNEIRDLKKLSESHYKVKTNLFYIDLNDAIEWASIFCQHHWSSRNRSYLTNIEDHELMITRNNDPHALFTSKFVEDRMSLCMAEEIRLEVDRETLINLGVPAHKIANHWFFFAEKSDAIRFAIRWGLE